MSPHHGESRQEGLIAFPGELRPASITAAEGPGKVDEVVADLRDAIDGCQDVVGVDRARAAVVEPGREDEQPAEVAPVLVGHGVVGVVSPRAPDLVRAEQRLAALRHPSRHGSVRLPRTGRHVPENEIDVSRDERTRDARHSDTACPSGLATSWERSKRTR